MKRKEKNIYLRLIVWGQGRPFARYLFPLWLHLNRLVLDLKIIKKTLIVIVHRVLDRSIRLGGGLLNLARAHASRDEGRGIIRKR